MKKQPAGWLTLPAEDRRQSVESGQLLVIFALALIAVVAMTGLIMDGGDTFLQRREQQNVTDAAAMAAGYAAVNSADASAAAQGVAATNGYTNGGGGVVVTVTNSGTDHTVTITKPHRNYFAGVVGFASWSVSTTATVRAGVPNGAYGVMPLIFNQKAFDNPANRDPNAPRAFGEPPVGTSSVPPDDRTFNWTVFCAALGNQCNSNDGVVGALIDGNGGPTTTYLNEVIDPLNAGSHTTEYDALSGKVGLAFPVAIVDDAGMLQSFAWFHITGSVGGSTKQVSGWFEDGVIPPAMTISPTGGTPGSVAGAYVVDLIN